jgi:hypothetical protein
MADEAKMEVDPQAERFGCRLIRLHKLSFDPATITNASRRPMETLNTCLNIGRTAINDAEVKQRDAHLYVEIL